MVRRVLFTESSRNVGGQELQLLAQADTLRARGIEPLILCRANGRMAEACAARNLPTAPVPFRNSLHPPSILALVRHLDAFRPDALICHSGHDANNAALAARLSRHRPRLLRARTYQHGLPHAWTYNILVDRTLVPSQEMRKALLTNPRIREERIAVLYPGIPFSDIDRRAVEALPPALAERLARAPQRRIVHGAMLRHEKGHLFMLDVVARVVRDFPDLCYVIAGEGELRSAIEEKIAALDIGSHVILAGMVDNLPALIRRSELLVMPSTYEPLGMSQIEALGLGIPVLASHTGGIPETVSHERTGLLLPPGDSAAWSAALAMALQRPREMQALAAAGKLDVQQRFSLETNIDQLLEHISGR